MSPIISLESGCPHEDTVNHNDDFGQVAIRIEARAGHPTHLTKFMVYHTTHTASPEELCGRAEWTMDRVMAQGFEPLLLAQEHYMADFWRRSDVCITDVWEDRTKRSTVEIQQGIRFNLFQILHVGSCGTRRIPAKGLTGQVGPRPLLLGHGNLPAAVSHLHLTTDCAKCVDGQAPNAAAGAPTCGAFGPSRCHVPVADDQRRGSIGVLRSGDRAIPYQCRYHVCAPEICASDRR